MSMFNKKNRVLRCTVLLPVGINGLIMVKPQSLAVRMEVSDPLKSTVKNHQTIGNGKVFNIIFPVSLFFLLVFFKLNSFHSSTFFCFFFN